MQSTPGCNFTSHRNRSVQREEAHPLALANRDLEQLPEHLVGELIDGELYASPRPASPHAMVASTLGMDLGTPFQRGRGGPVELAPDWVCEVLSPSTAQLDRVLKLPRYARAGVKHTWVVDPVHRTLEVFRQEHERQVLAGAFAGEERVRAEPFEAVEPH